jgi:hypothetical protein
MMALGKMYRDGVGTKADPELGNGLIAKGRQLAAQEDAQQAKNAPETEQEKELRGFGILLGWGAEDEREEDLANCRSEAALHRADPDEYCRKYMKPGQ